MDPTPSPRPAKQAAIELEGLTRVFRSSSGDVHALENLNLIIEQGPPVAILGENGAGKTTLTKILSTLLFPSSGTARVLGHDVVRDARTVREETSVVFGGDRGLYLMLSGVENMRYFGALSGLGRRTLLSRIPELLDRVGLAEVATRSVQSYSKGMRQRLHLAIGMLQHTPILLLDEPTVGLDPNEAERLRGIVQEIAMDGTTVLFTSHNLTDVERLASRVLMMRRGQVTQDLTLSEFRSLAGYDAVVTVTLALPDNGVRTETFPIRKWSPPILSELAERFAVDELIDLQVRPSTLDEAFAMASRSSS